MSTAPTPPPQPTVVGIGASAGGFTALKLFLDHVPADSGLAFVAVVHLSPNHESHLAELLPPHGRFPVIEVIETVALEPNHLYLIPTNANLSTIDTHLRLSKMEERPEQRAPIDHFFRTLAATHDHRGIAVVLSGTGSDGTLGVKEIKARGGFVIVQDPKEAEYDGMPQSAIATGLVDLILPLAEIPENILRHHRTRPRVPLSNDGGDVPRRLVEQYETGRERREASSEERLQRMANVPGVSVLIFDKRGTIVDCNEAFLAFSGYSRAEVSARILNWRNVTAEEYLPETERQFQLLAETGGINPYEKEMILKNGSHRWTLVASVSLGDGTSAEYCFDVADRKKAEDLIRRGDENLRKANRALLRSNSDLKHFSYAVSHDMLEPLRMVMSYTQLLARDFVSQDAKAQTYIRYAVDGAKQMQSMLTGLREYWSVEQEESEELAQCSMEAIFQHTLQHLREVIQNAGGAITHDPLPTVMGQEYPLQLLLQNLIQNALKYRRPDTPPRIHATAERDGRMFKFAIADNGIGIDPAETGVIFAPFKRLHPTKYPGSGLGLAMCQKVVERHLGRIWVESVPGKGSTFYFTLPAAVRHEAGSPNSH